MGYLSEDDTRKITRGLANISQSLEGCLFLGNIDALRDWGHAIDYVRMLCKSVIIEILSWICARNIMPVPILVQAQGN
jgi:hypothetical protein